MAFHEGRPVEFLYRIEAAPFDPIVEVWRVRPLFEVGSERDQIVRHGDRITPIHTRQK